MSTVGAVLGMRGTRRALTGGTAAPIDLPEPRPTVLADGTEYEVVWFPARGAVSLLGDEVSRPSILALPPMSPEDAARILAELA